LGLGDRHWFLLASLIAAVLWAAAVILAKFLELRAAGGIQPLPDGQPTSPLNAVITAIAGLIDSLAKAPVWFAIFVAGLALLWVSTATVSSACSPPADETSGPNPAASPKPTPSASGSPTTAPTSR
jgi:hypothetical protein